MWQYKLFRLVSGYLNGFKILKNEISNELFVLAENSKEKISFELINYYEENKKKN